MENSYRVRSEYQVTSIPFTMEVKPVDLPRSEKEFLPTSLPGVTYSLFSFMLLSIFIQSEFRVYNCGYTLWFT